MHNVRDTATAVGSAVGMASDAWRLARDAKAEETAREAPPGAPEKKRLSDTQRTELEERMRRRTMDLAWAMTKRQLEATGRDVVDRILGRAFAGGAAADAEAVVVGAGEEEEEAVDVGDDGAGASGDTSERGTVSPAELQARGDALVLVGGVFSGERGSNAAVERAVDGLSKLATHASEAKAKARNFLGGLVASASTPRAAEQSDAQHQGDEAPLPPPPADLGGFFREIGRGWR